MKINEIPSVNRIEKWTHEHGSHAPNEIQVAMFVRDIIPYLKHQEFEIERLQSRVDYLENQNTYLNGIVNG